MKTRKMKVEIWSDIVCPSCYIGKRKIETAIAQFDDRDNVEITWRSFQLDPDLITDPDTNLYRFLEERKGMDRTQVMAVSNQISGLAQQAGLVYNLEQAIPANSFRANQFSHMAKHHNMQDNAEEALFKAYFTDGKNIDDIVTLMQLGEEIGLDPTEVEAALGSGKYAADVEHDIFLARQSGITSVPTFVFDEKVKVTGVQESNVFLEILKKTIAEWKIEQDTQNTITMGGPACKIGEDCI